MDFFAILEIDQTTDEERIKQAYRDKLSTVNPEDDPEGFKRLRNAYEQAVAWARRPEEEEGPKGPVDLLIDRFEEVYDRMADRVNPEAWKALLQDPLFDSLDLEENAKWSLFYWLADHWRLPTKIWRLLDQFFFIRENGEEFREHLPEGFVDFMEQKLADSGRNSEFPYERFRAEQDGEADYDTFLTGYEEFCRLLEDEENLAAAEQKLDYLESRQITHPWFLLEKARFLVKAERTEDAVKLMEEMLESDGDDVQIYLGCARLYKELGFREKSLSMFEKLKDEKEVADSVRYHTYACLADYYEQDARLADARKMCLDAIDVYESEEMINALSRINGALIELWTKTPDTLSAEERYQLLWCYIQTERGQEGIDFLKAHGLYDGETLKWHRAKAILTLQTEQPADALEHCQNWRREIEAQEALPELSEEEQKQENVPECDVRLTREELKDSRMQSYRLEGDVYRRIIDTVPEEEKEEFVRKAREAYNKALEIKPDDISLMMSVLMLLRSQKEYQAMTELCEKIKEIDEGYYWAYFYAQEAYVNLRMGQEVIDNFYEAKRIYDGHAEIYERAVEVFMAYRQYHDVDKILDQAKEAGVESAQLKLQRLTLMEVQADNEEALREADAFAEKVIAEMEEENADPEILAAAYLERVYIQTDSGARAFRSEDNIIEWASRSVSLNDTVDARYSLGRAFCLFRDEPKNAMDNLKKCEERGMTFCWMYYYMARCYEDFEEWENAIEYYKKAMEADPEETDFAWRVAWLYRRKFSRTGQKVYADKAFEYLEKQHQICDNQKSSTDYWQYSDLYATLGQYEEALEAIEHALETDQRARNWGQKAQMLELLHRREEAVPFYEKGLEVEIEKGRDYAFSYSQMADYFCETHQYAEGIAWLEAWMPKVLTEEQKEDNLNQIKKLYIRLKQYDKALETIDRRYGSTDLTAYGTDTWAKEGVRIADLLDLYQYYLPADELEKKVLEAIALVEGEDAGKLSEDKQGVFRAYREIAFTYAHHLMDDRKGLLYFQKALKVLQDMGEDAERSDYSETYQLLMSCCYFLGEKNLARDYRRMFEEHIEKKYDECKELGIPPMEMHKCFCGRVRPNLYQLFMCAYFTEEYEKAREYVELMEKGEWCNYCTHAECEDLLECKGYLALLDGDTERARECFEAAEKSATHGDYIAEYELRKLDETRK